METRFDPPTSNPADEPTGSCSACGEDLYGNDPKFSELCDDCARIHCSFCDAIDPTTERFDYEPWPGKTHTAPMCLGCRHFVATGEDVTSAELLARPTPEDAADAAARFLVEVAINTALFHAERELCRENHFAAADLVRRLCDSKTVQKLVIDAIKRAENPLGGAR